MRRNLRPPDDAVLVPVAVEAEVVRLMPVAPRVHPEALQLRRARVDLLFVKGDVRAEAIVCLACSVQEHGLAVQQEPVLVVAVLVLDVGRNRPAVCRKTSAHEESLVADRDVKVV